MPLDPSAQSRNVIPRWRLSTQFSELPEVTSWPRKAEEVGESKSDLGRLLRDFGRAPTIGLAGELLSASVVEADVAAGKDAAEFILENPYAGSLLRGAAKAVLSGTVSQYATQQRSLALRPDVVFEKARFAEALSMVRSRVRTGFASAHSWLDLGYLESAQGDVKSAERAVLAALRVGGQSRIVRRSAARFFIHINEKDRALRVIEGATSYRDDPWLLSAHLAIESMIGRKPKHLKQALRIVDTDKFKRQDVSELSAAIATEEFQEGAIKKVKSIAKHALIVPTENTLAQLAWIDGVGKLHLVSETVVKNVQNAHEAMARISYANHDWSACCEAVWYWLADQPFSERAALFGSFVSLVLLDDPAQSEFFCNVGLRANPKDFMLLNNLAVAQLLAGKSIDAAQTLRRSPLPTSDQEKTVWLATQGLAKFRGGQHEAGRHYYQQSNDLARRLGDPRSVALNRLFLAKEEFRVGNTEEFFAKVSEMASALRSANSELAGAIAKEVKAIRDLPLGEESATRLRGLIKLLDVD